MCARAYGAWPPHASPWRLSSSLPIARHQGSDLMASLKATLSAPPEYRRNNARVGLVEVFRCRILSGSARKVGVPKGRSPHGPRKACCRRLADAKALDREIHMAVEVSIRWSTGESLLSGPNLLSAPKRSRRFPRRLLVNRSSPRRMVNSNMVNRSAPDLFLV